jgi:hypothetical protein
MSLASIRLRTTQWGLLAAILSVPAAALAGESGSIWDFSVHLDERPIGTHRFELTPTGDGARSLRSAALFEVKIFGITAYRYRHHAEEKWSRDCLKSISAKTDDDGEITAVNGNAKDGNFPVSSLNGKKPSQVVGQGCLLTFAYWNPENLATQRLLLDSGTGRIEPVTITALPTSTIPVHNTPTPVYGLRITGLKHPIDVWYAAGNRWVGLDTTVEGGRKLTYRLP